MKIGFDARVAYRYPGGHGRYCTSLLQHIAQLDSHNQYVIFMMDDSLSFLRDYSNFQLKKINFPPVSTRTLFWFYKLIKECKLDIFHAPSQMSPILVPCPLVITVHDMMDLNYKYAFHHQPFLKRKALETYFRFSLPRAIRRATQIIADSENTREDILKYFGLPFDKVKVIHLGLEETFKPIRDHNLLQRIRNKYKLNRKYLLYIGNTRRNKNIDGLLRGFHYLINHFQVDPQLTLVVAGYKQYRSRELREKVQKLGFINRFMQLGTIDEQDLSAVYSAAEIFLMPSFYEGFGLPALEAMACGTPVVVSNTSSLPEVVGDAGIFINPHSPEDIANGIYKLLMDETLRSNLIEKGMKRVEKFSWNEAAQKLLTIYQEVACRK